jgi:hypothetical protein
MSAFCRCLSPRQGYGGDELVNMFEVDRPAKVREGLFIGSWESESDKDMLEKLGITHVLQVGAAPAGRGSRAPSSAWPVCILKRSAGRGRGSASAARLCGAIPTDDMTHPRGVSDALVGARARRLEPLASILGPGSMHARRAPAEAAPRAPSAQTSPLVALQVGAELAPSFEDSFTYLKVAIDDAVDQDLITHLQEPLEFIGVARQTGACALPRRRRRRPCGCPSLLLRPPARRP